MSSSTEFTPAAGRFAPTVLYDRGVALLTRESVWRGELLRLLKVVLRALEVVGGVLGRAGLARFLDRGAGGGEVDAGCGRTAGRGARERHEGEAGGKGAPKVDGHGGSVARNPRAGGIGL